MIDLIRGNPGIEIRIFRIENKNFITVEVMNQVAVTGLQRKITFYADESVTDEDIAKEIAISIKLIRE